MSRKNGALHNKWCFCYGTHWFRCDIAMDWHPPLDRVLANGASSEDKAPLLPCSIIDRDVSENPDRLLT